jgi:aspartyl/asparaginyl beta-hydroxylase (cupin superfamily)
MKDAGANVAAQVRGLLEAAERATAAGQLQQAAAYLGQAQSLAPQDAKVLAAVGMQALREGNVLRARETLQGAVDADATQPMLWLNLALACRAARDSAAEMSALQQALTLDPYFSLALLQKATLLERQHKPRTAARFYRAFLLSLPDSPQATIPMQPAIQRAQAAIRDAATSLDVFLAEALREVRASHAAEPLQRFDRCLRVLTGQAQVYVQQPTFMNFPGLPAIEFYEPSDFPWLPQLEQASESIRLELLGVLNQSKEELVPYVEKADGTPLNQWKQLNRSLDWSAYYLWRDGSPVESHLARCPKTAAVLAQLPLAQIAKHAPTAFFSILKPRTRIPPHTGVTNSRLVAHLPLIVPPGCAFRVGSEIRAWQLGRAWVFDDTIEHEAWNDSDELRAVLIFDIWNPHLTSAERRLVAAATAAVGEFNDHETSLSGGAP